MSADTYAAAVGTRRALEVQADEIARLRGHDLTPFAVQASATWHSHAACRKCGDGARVDGKTGEIIGPALDLGECEGRRS